MDPDVLGEFFDYLWHDTQGYCYLPISKDDHWKAVFYAWPRQRAAVIRHVLKNNAVGVNVFHSPALYKAARPAKENVLGSWTLWVDFDGNAPKEWKGPVPEPTLKIQSSIEGHQHCYWQLDEFLTDVSMLEDRNRAISYTLKADSSGWDADQILRPPTTTNYKRDKLVSILDWKK